MQRLEALIASAHTAPDMVVAAPIANVAPVPGELAPGEHPQESVQEALPVVIPIMA